MPTWFWKDTEGGLWRRLEGEPVFAARRPSARGSRVPGVPGKKKKRCQACAACLTPDCGACKHCMDKPIFGGPGTQKQCCIHRRCLHPILPEIEAEAEAEAAGSFRTLFLAQEAKSSGGLAAGSEPLGGSSSHPPQGVQIVETDASCVVCGGGDDTAGNEILLCDGDGCEAAYHLLCVSPPLSAIPRGDWLCAHCCGGSQRGNVAASPVGQGQGGNQASQAGQTTSQKLVVHTEAPAPSAGVGGASGVTAVLERLGLLRYAQKLEDLGYDDLLYLSELSEAELRDVAVDVEMLPGHVRKFARWFGDAAKSALRE